MRTLVRKGATVRADTIFFPEGVARAIHGLDPDLPYFLGGELPPSCLLTSFGLCWPIAGVPPVMSRGVTAALL